MQVSKTTGYFTIFVGKDDQYYFNLKAGNHEIILQSEGYITKSNALNGIRSVQENCADDNRYKRKIDKNKNPYFTLTARNGEPIGKGEDYTSTQMMEKGIDSVKKNGLSSVVKGCEDETLIIKVNKQSFSISANFLKGIEILQLVGFSSNGYCLYLQMDGKQVEVNSDEIVTLIDGMCFLAIIRDIKFG